jgi:NAD(P)-dependent dehydrogenase (short-subunit alcohol dehydrogenase family)
VTGGGRGIGRALVGQILKSGGEVIATVRSESAKKELENWGEKNPKLHVLLLDVSDPKSLGEFSQALSKFEAIDVLINNAGVLLDQRKGFDEIDPETILDTFRVNTLGPILVTRAVKPKLMKSSHPVVAHITSQMGSISDNSSGGYYAYRISKAALNMFNKSFSVDFPRIVSVVIHPGWVQTDMGGAGASTPPEKSAEGILKVISNLKSGNSGEFFNYKGEKLAW